MKLRYFLLFLLAGTALSPAAQVLTCTSTVGPVQVNVPYTTTCTPSGGIAPWTFTTNSLLPGLSTSIAGGSITITGSPSLDAVGKYYFAVQATDSSSPANVALAEFTGVIAPSVSTLQISCSPTTGPTTQAVAYAATCVASGGTPPYQWGLGGSSSFPPGLNLTTGGATVTVTGTVTNYAQPYSYMLQVNDSGTPTAAFASYIFNGTIDYADDSAPPLLGCSPVTGPAEVGVRWTSLCTASAGTPPYSWAAADPRAVPAGLGINAQANGTASFTGVPTAAGPYSFGLLALDANVNDRHEQFYTGTIVAAPTITCSSSAGPTLVGQAYTNQCSAQGGSSPYTYWISAGALPAGLTLDATTGIVSGTPLSSSAYTFAVQVYDGATGRALTPVTFTGTVTPMLSLACTPVSGPAEVRVQYSATCTAQGGVPPYFWFLAQSTSPPPGITFASSGATATLTGAPVSQGPYQYIVAVGDSVSEQQSVTYTGSIVAAVQATCTNAAAPTQVGQPYTTTCTATNGVAPYRWVITNLPPGLSTSPGASPVTGPVLTIAGAAQQPGGVSYTAALSDAIGGQVNIVWTGAVAPAVPVLLSVTPATVTAGGPSFTLTFTGTYFDSTARVIWNSTQLTPASISPTQITVTIPAALYAVPASESVSVVTQGGTSAPLVVAAVAGPVLQLLAPSTAAAGSGPVPLTITGTGFTPGATALWNGTAVPTTVISNTQLVATVPVGLLASPGTVAVSVVAAGIASAPLSFVITANAAIIGLQPTPTPTEPATVGVQITTPASVDLNGTLQLSFAPSVAGLPANYVEPALQFSCTGATCSNGNTALNFTIPAGQTTLSPVPGGSIQQGTVAGTITVSLSSLRRSDNGANVSPGTPVTGTLVVPALPPVITTGSVKVTNRTATGFTVELNGFSSTREVTSVVFTFLAAPGTQISGNTSFTIPVSSAFATWFNSTDGQSNGSVFGLTVPFTVSGSSNVVQKVVVTLRNNVGFSTSETGQIIP